jgi:XRE family aerobic/anaerobic benzoate catabolism transcriptional regulator
MASNPAIDDNESGRLLAVLGERVRTLRAYRGMTRKVLSQESGVSERYLAQLEQGRVCSGFVNGILLKRS